MKYLTPKQLAERWSCHPSHIRSLIREGQLSAMRLGTDWRIGLEVAEAYEAANTTSAETGSSSSTSNEGRKEEVRAPVTVDGFTLPADYEPCFPDLWPLHETKKAASQRH